jgi:hypothetical protein
MESDVGAETPITNTKSTLANCLWLIIILLTFIALVVAADVVAFTLGSVTIGLIVIGAECGFIIVVTCCTAIVLVVNWAIIKKFIGVMWEMEQQ